MHGYDITPYLPLVFQRRGESKYVNVVIPPVPAYQAPVDIPEAEGLFAGGTYDFLKLATSAGHLPADRGQAHSAAGQTGQQHRGPQEQRVLERHHASDLD